MTEVVASGTTLANRYEVRTLQKATPAMFFGEAYDSQTGQSVTVHLFHSKVSAAPRWRETFLADAGRLMTLPDFDQPVVLDRFVDGDLAGLVCKSIEGSPLISEGERQDTGTVMAWAIDIASLLAHLHGLSTPVFGRSSRPETLWRKLNGAATMLRFGVPEPPAATSTTHSISPYQAPETFGNNARQATGAADTWWLGAIMLLALYGKKPPSGPDRAARNIHLSRPADVPDDMWHLVEQMVSLKAPERPRAVEVQKRLIQLQF